MATENYEVVIAAHIAGQYVATVLHTKCTIATPVNPYLTALLLIQNIDTAGLLEKWLDCLPSPYKVTSLRARKVGSGGGVTAVLLASDLSATDGTRGSAVSTSAINPVLTLVGVTDVNSPGRVYIPGVAEDDIAENLLSASLIGSMQAFGVEFDAGGSLGGADVWVGGIYRRAINTVDTIAGTQVSPMIGNQRRRMKPI